jgi:hypothetical protein
MTPPQNNQPLPDDPLVLLRQTRERVASDTGVDTTKAPVAVSFRFATGNTYTFDYDEFIMAMAERCRMANPDGSELSPNANDLVYAAMQFGCMMSDASKMLMDEAEV